MTIEWRKESDDYIGEEPGSYQPGLGNTPEGKWFDAMTWRVRDGHVSFVVPATPPYFCPALSLDGERYVLASLNSHLNAEALR